MVRLLLFLIAASFAGAAERPNILWITSEDNDKFWLGCYGSEQAKTPHLDALAERSLRFENFFSNAPVCAVARSTILTGVHAASQGTQHMRSRHPIPDTFKPYVTTLREAGYYTSNASKTDYNFKINDKELWHQCSGSAHYKNRAEGQPFFAIFNLTESHESSLFADKIEGRRSSGSIPETPRVNPSNVEVRPYLPDLPEVRHDLAVYHDNITHMDSRVGKILDELESKGLSEDTIIFYYSDHGGVLPRGKRYLTDTGVNVPLLVHFPKKWQHLSSFQPAGVTQEAAAFVDLAPTLLSLLGIATPEHMQGRAFLGEHRKEPGEDDFIFLFADRFDEIYGMRRGVTNGRWKYIRRFSPHYPAAPYSYYQFGQKAWGAWRKAWQAGELEEPFNRIWEKNQLVEELYDTKADRWEVNNLANYPAHQEQLTKMRLALQTKMKSLRDTGLIPEPMFAELSPEQPVLDFVQKHQNWSQFVDFAFLATESSPDIPDVLLEKLASKDPLERYWSTQGCLIRLTDEKKKREADLVPIDTIAVEKALRTLLTDPHSAIRAAAAQTLIEIGSSEGAVDILLNELSQDNHYAQLNAVNIFTQLDILDQIPDAWIKKHKSKGKRSKDYVVRLANKLAAERGL